MKSTIKRTLTIGAAVIAMALSGTHAHAATSAAAPSSDTVNAETSAAATGKVILKSGITFVREWLNPGADLCKPFQAVSNPFMHNLTNTYIYIFTTTNCTGGFWVFESQHSGYFYTGVPRSFMPAN